MIWLCSGALNIDTDVEMTLMPNEGMPHTRAIPSSTTLKTGLALLLNYHFKL